AEHMPSFVVLTLAQLLQEGRTRLHLDPFVYIEIDRERGSLVDHVGGCERILKSPLPAVYAIEIRRFICFFLVTLPFALLDKLDYHWVNPLVTMVVAYILLSLDEIGIELQN